MYHTFDFNCTDDEKEMILKGTLFKDWLSTMDTTITIQGLEFKSADFIQKKGKKHLLFLKINTDAVDEKGRKVNGIVFLRGGAVGCLIILKCEGEKYVLYVEQARIGMGSRNCAEIPAGMLDHSSDYEGVMITELDEEAHVQVERGELVDLTEEVLGIKDTGIYVSVGGMDEFLRMFLLEREVEREYIEQRHDLQRIHDSEDEVIQIKVEPYEKAQKAMSHDVKNLCAFYLYEKWKKNNA